MNRLYKEIENSNISSDFPEYVKLFVTRLMAQQNNQNTIKMYTIKMQLRGLRIFVKNIRL